MLKQANTKSDRGFTLTELMAVLVVVGVIAAIAAPSFLGLLSRNRLEGALQELLGAINEAQRLAMLRGKSCTVNIDTNTNNITASTAGCLLSNRQLNSEIKIDSNFRGTTNISFSYRGNTTRMGTIVLSSNNTNLKKCFVISLGTGIKRVGNYEGDDLDSISYTNCKTMR